MTPVFQFGSFHSTPLSISIGNAAVAPTSTQAMALGHSNAISSSGINCFINGLGNTISGSVANSVLVGVSNTSSGTGSNHFVFGANNTLSGTPNLKVAIGISHTITTSGFALGNACVVSGDRNVALGTSTTLSGNGFLGYCTPDHDATFQLQRFSSTSVVRPMTNIVGSWFLNTDAARAGMLSLQAYYISTAQEGIKIVGDAGGVQLGFYNVAAVARPAAYTQTYSTADRTLSAYTPDVESSAYTGAADSEAKLADLNALRVAYENLRTFVEDLAQHHNSVLDDLQANGLLQ
jgi:hypothetical protein